MIGCGFENVSGGALNIQDFVSGLEARAEQAPFLQVWNGTKLDTYTYEPDIDWDTFEEISVWKNGVNVADIDIPAGFACWFMEPKSDVTITVAGQVVEPTTKTVNLAADTWYMIANPYPIATSLNDGLIDWSGLVASAENAPFIQFWNGTKLDTYTYEPDIDWDTFEEISVWKQGVDVAELEIPAQTGFWIRVPKTAGSVSWKKAND